MSEKHTTYFDVITRVQIIHDKRYTPQELERIAYNSTFCGSGFGTGPNGVYDKKEVSKKVEVVK